MANIATLVVSLGANSAKLVEGLKKSTNSVQKWAKDVKKKADSVAKVFAPIGKAIGLVGKAALAATGAATAFFAAMTVKTGAIKEIDTMAKAFGVSRTALQEWTYAAEQVGLEGDKMGDIFKDVSDKLNDFLLTGAGPFQDIFEQLKLDAKDFIGLSPDKALLKINEAMQGITQGEKIFFMESLAGDAAKLLPLLEGNAEGLKKLSAEANSLGLILSDQQIDNAVRFSESMKRLTGTVSGFFNQVAGNLAAPLGEVVEFIQKELIQGSFGGIQNAARMASGWIVGFVRNAIAAVAKLPYIWNEVIGGVAGIKTAFHQLHKAVIDTLGTIGQLGVILTPSVWGKALGINFANSTTENFRNAMAEKSIEIEKTINDIAKNAESNVALGFDTEALDKLDAKLAEIEASFAKPIEIDAKSADKTTTSTDNLRGSTDRNTQSIDRLSKIMDARKDGEKKTPADIVGKIPPMFKSYLQQAQKHAYQGDQKATDYMLNRARDVLKATGGGSFGADQNFDVRAMQSAFDEMGSFVQKIGMKETKTAAVASENSITNKLLMKISETLEKKAEPVGSLSLDMTTDTGKIAGEIFGEQTFLRNLAKFVNKNTNSAARAATA